MNAESRTSDSIGYLLVKVSTALGAIPLSDASVLIRGTRPENAEIQHTLRSNRDGLTERIALPTPPRSASETPGDAVPYYTYNIEVAKEGYLPLSFSHVPVFPTVTSIQPAVMVPAPNAYEIESPQAPSLSAPPPFDSEGGLS